MVINERTDSKVLQQTIERFWEVIPPVWNTIKGNVRGLAAEQYEISVEQFQFLRMIRRGVVSVSELAEHKQISRSAVSQAVDLLVEKGLVGRRQDVSDRRYVHLALTPAGDEMLNSLFRQNRAWMAGRMTELSDEGLQTIIQAMELLKTTFIDTERAE